MPARRSNYMLLSQSADPVEPDHHSNYVYHIHRHHYSLPDRLGFDPCPDTNNNNVNIDVQDRQQQQWQQPRPSQDWGSPLLDVAQPAGGRGIGGIWPPMGGNSYGARCLGASSSSTTNNYNNNHSGLQRQSSGSSFAESSLSSDYPLPTLSPSISLNASDSAFFNALYEDGWKHNVEGGGARLMMLQQKQAEGGGGSGGGGSSSSSSSNSSSAKGKNWAQQTEESYHLQLALALRVSAEASCADDPHLLATHCDEPLAGSGGGSARKHIEALCHRFWVNGYLSYHDKIPNGFYQLWGMNPYVWTMCNDSRECSRMPSLESLKSVNAIDSSLEVILIDKRGDSHLRELQNKALSLVYGCANKKEVVEQLGNLVCNLMGGAASTEHGDLMMRWDASSKMLRDCLTSIVFSIGSLSVGLCRHRALLFKVLADTIDLPCRIARGCRYCGKDDGSSCIVQCGDDREYVVDLIGRPGVMSEPDSFLNGPSSILIASPLRLPELKSSLFTDEFRSLAKEYMTNFKFLDPALDNVSQVQVASTIDSEPATIPSASASSIPFTGTQPLIESSDKSTFPAQVAVRCVIEKSVKASNEIHAPDYSKIPIEIKSSHMDSVSPVTKHSDDDYLQQRLLHGCKQRDAQSRFNEEECLNERWLKAHKQKDVPVKINDEDRLQQRVTHLHKDAQAMLELPQGTNKMKEGRHDEAGNLLSTKANLQLSLSMDVLEIPWSDLVLKERIGAGSFGTVHHADWNGSDVAVKILIEQDFHEERLKEFLREVAIMKRLRHPNVVLFMGAVLCRPNLSIVTEYLPRGSLYRLIHRPGTREILDERRRLRMALDVAKGMNHLHRLNPPIVHRDLKSPNLLVDKTWTVKVCDFGLSRLKANTFLSSKSAAGTPEWMAPEVLRDEPSNEKSDVYSFGVILWELITLQQPWSGLNAAQVVGAVGFQNRRLQIPKDVKPEIAAIIEACWANDPRKRPSFASIMDLLKPLVKPPTSQQIRGVTLPPA